MGTETFLIILLVWTITGFFAAIAFGRAIRETNSASNDETLAFSTGSIKYIQRNKHRSPATHANIITERAHVSVSKRATA
jgi:hypothetical protein